MNRQLEVVLTKTFDGNPLAVLCNLPGSGAEMRPGQMRALADALHAAANECDANAIRGKDFRCTKRIFPLLRADRSRSGKCVA